MNLKTFLEDYHNAKAVLFDSGRSALFIGLNSIHSFSPEKNEVLISSYTCLVVINAILKAGLRPVYIDINADDLSLNKKAILANITDKTLAIIIQNSLGFLDDYTFYQELKQNTGIYIIEDLAHIMSKKISAFTDFAIHSFSSNKIISTSRAGAFITENTKLYKLVFHHQEMLKPLPVSKLCQHLLKIFIHSISMKYYFFIGRYILGLLFKLSLLPKVIDTHEKNIELSQIKIYKLSPLIRFFVFKKCLQLNHNLEHRTKITSIYNQILNIDYPVTSYLFYPILVEDPHSTNIISLKNKILLNTTWSYSNIVPTVTDDKKIEYVKNSCKIAEYIAKHIILLPTDLTISEKQAQKIATFIKLNIKYGKLHCKKN